MPPIDDFLFELAADGHVDAFKRGKEIIVFVHPEHILRSPYSDAHQVDTYLKEVANKHGVEMHVSDGTDQLHFINKER